MKAIAKKILLTTLCILSPLFLVIAFPFCIALGLFHRQRPHKPRLVWGINPILNNSYWARAMKAAGYNSETYTVSYFKDINQREQWDRILTDEYTFLPMPLKYYLAFLSSLLRYDVFFISFNGFFLGRTPLWRLESLLLKCARKKIIAIPYGSDAYVYADIRSTSLIHGLLMSYPQSARMQTEICERRDYWCKNADAVIPGFIGFDGCGRWDVLTVSQLHIDTTQWQPSQHVQKSTADGKKGMIKIVHAPNHRGFKGTEFIIETVEKLKKEGLKIELTLLEKMQNSKVKEILCENTDILIEQLIFTGHGLNGVEGMAAGVPVISNLEDENYTLPLRRWSYLNECPIASASPETLEHVLKQLITNPDLRKKLGNAGKQYVEKYHSYSAAQYLFGEVIKYVYGERESIINLYHPLLGDDAIKTAKIQHPLLNNHISNK